MPSLGLTGDFPPTLSPERALLLAVLAILETLLDLDLLVLVALTFSRILVLSTDGKQIVLFNTLENKTGLM